MRDAIFIQHSTFNIVTVGFFGVISWHFMCYVNQNRINICFVRLLLITN